MLELSYGTTDNKKGTNTMETLNFTLGADPELSLQRVSDGARIHAREFVDHLAASSVFPRVSMGVKLKTGIFGHDGAEHTAELRPNPGATPKELTNNIGELIREIEFVTAGRIRAITDCRAEQVGGHIHISIPSTVTPTIKNAVAWTLFLSSPLLRATSDITRERRTGYGSLDDVRFDAHGTVRTAELRFLPAEWLTTPQTTEAVLSYIACVYYEALNNQEVVAKSYQRFLNGDIGQFNLKTLQSLEKEMPSLFDFVVKKIRADLCKFACYEQYKKQIRYILNPEKVKAAHQKVNYDAFVGWCPSRSAPPPPRPSAAGPTLQQFINNEVPTAAEPSKPKKEKKVKVEPGREHLLAAQARSIEFIEGYGSRRGGSETPSLLSHSGDVNLDFIHNELTRRITTTGLPVTVPVYIYGVASEHADLTTVVSGYSQNHQVRISNESREVIPTVRERLGRVAISHEGTPNVVVMGIPWSLRRPNELEGAVRKIAELFYKIQKSEVEFTAI